MNAREIGLNQTKAAYIAEISERTGQRIEAGQHQPNRGKVKSHSSTQDPLGDVWDKELEPMLKKEPRLKPMTLFESGLGKLRRENKKSLNFKQA